MRKVFFNGGYPISENIRGTKLYLLSIQPEEVERLETHESEII
jgi:hypothetical protein